MISRSNRKHRNRKGSAALLAALFALIGAVQALAPVSALGMDDSGIVVCDQRIPGIFFNPVTRSCEIDTGVDGVFVIRDLFAMPPVKEPPPAPCSNPRDCLSDSRGNRSQGGRDGGGRDGNGGGTGGLRPKPVAVSSPAKQKPVATDQKKREKAIKLCEKKEQVLVKKKELFKQGKITRDELKAWEGDFEFKWAFGNCSKYFVA